MSRSLQSRNVSLTIRPRRKLRIRCVAKPDQAQTLLLDRLGLRLPQRLRPPRSIPDRRTSKCSADFWEKCMKILHPTARTVELGLESDDGAWMQLYRNGQYAGYLF